MNRRQMIAAVFALPVAAAAAALPRRETTTVTLDRARGELSWSYRSATKWYAPPGEYTYYRRVSAAETRRLGGLVI